MDVGVGLPAGIPNTEGADIAAWATGADAGPFGSVAVIDRIAYDCYDPLVALSAAAVLTKRVKLATTILISHRFSTVRMADQIIAGYFNLNQAEGGKDTNNEAIAGALLGGTHPAEVLALRQLIFLWYMGAWPTVHSDDSPTRGQTFSEIVSATSYTQGLVWRVMQSHPMGSSNYTYGYWADDPPALKDYLENPA